MNIFFVQVVVVVVVFFGGVEMRDDFCSFFSFFQLVENGATIDVPKNWKSSRGSFPASFYAAAVGSESVLQFLFKRGASSSQIHQNLSLLHIAIHRNHLSLADRLLHRGMSPELDSGWMPPLHVAAQDGNLPAGFVFFFFF